MRIYVLDLFVDIYSTSTTIEIHWMIEWNWSMQRFKKRRREPLQAPLSQTKLHQDLHIFH